MLEHIKKNRGEDIYNADWNLFGLKQNYIIWFVNHLMEKKIEK
jgi:hypothetical protein